MECSFGVISEPKVCAADKPLPTNKTDTKAQQVDIDPSTNPFDESLGQLTRRTIGTNVDLAKKGG